MFKWIRFAAIIERQHDFDARERRVERNLALSAVEMVLRVRPKLRALDGVQVQVDDASAGHFVTVCLLGCAVRSSHIICRTVPLFVATL